MKYFLSLLLVLGFLAGRAQVPQKIGNAKTLNYIPGQLMVDSLFYLPYRDTTIRPDRPGGLVLTPQKELYLWDGTAWIPFGQGGPTPQGPYVYSLYRSQDTLFWTRGGETFAILWPEKDPHFDSLFARKTTSDLAEGTNLYHTLPRVRQALSAGPGINYDPLTGVIGAMGGGSLRYVGLTVPQGFTVEGSPVRDSGVFRIRTTLNGLVRGTGTGFSTVYIAAPLQLTSGGVLGLSRADSLQDGYLSKEDWRNLWGKEPFIQPGDTTQYWRGDKTWQALTTTAVTEGTNLYLTVPRVRSALSAEGPIRYDPEYGIISAQQATDSTDGFLTWQDYQAVKRRVPDSRAIRTRHSLVGGGYLNEDLTLSLENDVTAPGAMMYYGTDSSGGKGWYRLPFGSVGNYVTPVVAGANITVTGSGLPEDPWVISGPPSDSDTGQINSDWAATEGVALILNKPNLHPVATSGDYNDLKNRPNMTFTQVNADWNATSGAALILNKPTIPAAQVPADWNATTGVARILNKPLIDGSETKVTAGQNVTVTGTGTAASPYVISAQPAGIQVELDPVWNGEKALYRKLTDSIPWSLISGAPNFLILEDGEPIDWEGGPGGDTPGPSYPTDDSSLYKYNGTIRDRVRTITLQPSGSLRITSPLVTGWEPHAVFSVSTGTDGNGASMGMEWWVDGYLGQFYAGRDGLYYDMYEENGDDFSLEVSPGRFGMRTHRYDEAKDREYDARVEYYSGYLGIRSDSSINLVAPYLYAPQLRRDVTRNKLVVWQQDDFYGRGEVNQTDSLLFTEEGDQLSIAANPWGYERSYIDAGYTKEVLSRSFNGVETWAVSGPFGNWWRVEHTDTLSQLRTAGTLWSQKADSAMYRWYLEGYDWAGNGSFLHGETSAQRNYTTWGHKSGGKTLQTVASATGLHLGLTTGYHLALTPQVTGVHIDALGRIKLDVPTYADDAAAGAAAYPKDHIYMTPDGTLKRKL